MSSLPVSLKFALREIRFGLKHFKIFLACLFLGTAIIAGVGSVTDNITQGLRDDAKLLLGGDLEISLIQQEITADQKQFITDRGEVSEIVTMRAMSHVTTPGEEDSTLVFLKAIDDVYPLYGDFTIRSGNMPDNQPNQILSQENGQWGALLSDALATRLNLGQGDQIKLGDIHLNVRGVIDRQPDNNAGGFQLAPGLIISKDSLEDTGLIKPGSLARYYYRIKLNQDVSLSEIKQDLSIAYPEAGWRIRDSSQGGENVRQFITRLGQFMTLVGLTALLVGGVGVGNAVNGYLGQKTKTIATLKILGASSQIILQTYLLQITLMALIAITAGLMAGAFVPLILKDVIEAQIPIPIDFHIAAKPLILSVFYSLMITFIFVLAPLGFAKEIPAARLFRQFVQENQTAKLPLSFKAIIFSSIVILVSAILYTATFIPLTAGFLAGAVGAFAVLYFAAYLIKKGAQKLPRPQNPGLRIALSNLFRPGNATTSIVLSLGLGLILFTAISLVRYNLDQELQDRVSTEAPSFFFVDIQKDQLTNLRDNLNSRVGVDAFESVPNLRGRITHVAGVPAKEVTVSGDASWMLRGDRGITFRETLPDNSDLVRGEWWPIGYSGPPQISITEEMAVALNLDLGDQLTVNVLGRDITAEIVSTRTVDWGSFAINYVIMFDPNSLKAAPYTNVATAQIKNAELEDKIYREVAQSFPGISIIRIKDVLENVAEILTKISGAINSMNAITLIAGTLVLAGAIAAGHRNRIYDSAVLKILGATRRDILRAYVLEFILLGVITGLIAIILGGFAAYAVVTQVMELSWHFSVSISAITISASVAFTMICGMISLWLAMSARPAQVLRNT